MTNVYLYESIILFLFSVYTMIRAQIYIDDKIPKDFPRLYDHFHLYLPDLSKYYKLGDVAIIYYLVALLCFYNNRIDIFLISLSVLYLFRTFSFTVTLLPKCGNMPDKDMTRSASRIILDYIVLRDTHFGSRIDMLPSGHCMVLTLITIHIIKFGDPHILVKYLLWISTIGLYLLTILSRCHYTVDVLFAYIATCFFYEPIAEYLR